MFYVVLTPDVRMNINNEVTHKETTSVCFLLIFILILSALCRTGNMRSALNDAAAARKIKPDHLKAVIRGM